MGILDQIKADARNSGSSRGKFIFLRDGDKLRVRFLQDMDDGFAVDFHRNFDAGLNVPCQKVFGRDCPYDDDEDVRTRTEYVWSVYDYDAKEVRLFMYAANNYSPLPQLVGFYEEYGTLTDRDYVIKQTGKGLGKQYSVIPQNPTKFRVAKAKPISRKALLDVLDKAYPDDSAPAKSKGGTPFDDVVPDSDLDDEEEGKYDDIPAKRLYQMCVERGLEVEKKKPARYYANKLEEDDRAEDDWGDGDDDDDDEWDDEEE